MRYTKNKLEKAFRYLRWDVGDDFWPDIVNYQDLLDIEIFKKISFDQYIANPQLILDIPKPTLILRPGHYLDLTDRFYYQLLVNEVAKKTDSNLLGRDIVFGNRVKDSDGHFFHNGINSWKKFQEKTELFFNTHPTGFLLKTDITAYFEHINIKKLIITLENLGAKGAAVEQLLFLLKGWSNNGIGIPQGYDQSSFLGNIYLNEVDQAMIADGFNYYRFADDIKVFEIEEKKLRKAISRLTELLRPLNLHLSGGKTKIIQREEYYSEKLQFTEDMDAINYGINQGENAEITENSLKLLWSSGLKAKKFDKTTINFCLNRFRKIKSKYALKAVLSKNLFDPSIAPSVTSYLELFINTKSVQCALLAAFKNTSYEYQRIFILKTLAAADKLFFNLNEIDREEIYKSGNFMLVGYYLIFAYKFGNDGVRSLVKTKFNNTYKTDPKISRYFLFALNSNPVSRSEMKTFVNMQPSLKRTYKFLVQ
jgi:hypothetical protein